MQMHQRQTLGILDGVRLQKNQQQNFPYVHNPYWYEGFTLTPSPTVVYDRWAGYNRGASYQPQPWAERRLRPQRASRPTTLKQYVDFENNWKPRSPQTDNSSDNTLGYSDSERSDSERERHDVALERQLVQRIVEYFGECKGSLPSERVQNVIKKDYAELYEAVVVARFRKKWHKFLQYCSDTFQLFTRPAQPAPNQDYCWRIRLLTNTDWEEADEQDEEYRTQRDRELLEKVRTILINCPENQCLMIDVINELNKDAKLEDPGIELDDAQQTDGAGRKARKIRAGDLKRLMRKCNSNFTIVEVADAENQKRSTYMKLVEPTLAIAV